VVGIVHVARDLPSTGRTFADYEAHVWTFDGKGRVTRFRHLLDTHQHWLATAR